MQDKNKQFAPKDTKGGKEILCFKCKKIKHLKRP